MNPRTYAKALIHVGKSTNGAQVAERLIEHLRAAGRSKLLPKILRILKEEQQKTASLASVIEIASEKDTAAALQAAKEQGMEGSVKINHALIRGWRARANGIVLDHSAKRSLIELYRNSTGHY